MLKLRNMTIKHKLISIIMLACIAALLLAGAAFIVWEWTAIRQDMVRYLSTNAAIIADNCKAALAFEEAKDAEETLKALHVEPSIVFGSVYTRSGKIFASYYRGDTGSMEHPEDSRIDLPELQEYGYSFSHGFLTVFRPIVLDAETIGIVCLRSDLRPMYVMLKHNITVIIAVLLLCSLVAYFVSSRLQGVVSKPIFKLAESAAKIGKGELDHKVKIQSKDELGHLGHAFNKMTEDLKKTTTSIDNLNREVAEREKAEEKLQKNVADLERFNRLAVGRELQMIELKREVNALLGELGREGKYRAGNVDNASGRSNKEYL